MRALLRFTTLLLRCLPAFFRSRNEQAIVELALRQQLATYAQARSSAQAYSGGSRILGLLVTTLAWLEGGAGHRPTRHRGPLAPKGLPPLLAIHLQAWPRATSHPPEVQALIRRFANENGWRTRKIQAELEKLGLRVSLATVSRYLPKRKPDRDQHQRWMTFLRNHKDGIAAMDFLVVPTLRFQLLYVWFVIAHGRRRILHFGVTAYPTSPWVVQQLREEFPEDTAPRFLIYDNDSIFADEVSEAIGHLGIEPRRTAYRSPWQNGMAERWVGSARRELLDHVIVLNEQHLQRLLREYVDYYNADRVHTRLRDSPIGRPTENRRSAVAQIVGLPRVGGLRHRYAWREAA
jgi:transposase InsO family protein